MFMSYYRSATGAIAVETQEESRMLRDLRLELPEDATIAEFTAPTGALTQVKFVAKENRIIRVKDPILTGDLAAVYAWLGKAPGRVAVIYDAHMLMNNPGTWRTLINQLPMIRSPEGDGNAGLIVFVAPGFDFTHHNPLRGIIPVLQYATPDRESLRAIADRIHALPDGRDGKLVVDALCGLGADVAEQVCAENLVAHKAWHPATLNEARRRKLREAGLEIWTPVTELAGLGGIQDFVNNEVLPWMDHPTLSIRRILACGVMGSGKSFFARWIASKVGCECVRLSLSRMKGSLVGQSEAALRRALKTIDDMAAEAPLVVVIEEIDTIARDGADGGTSASMFQELLVWTQESRSRCIVIGTLNHLSRLDSALSRRFTSQFYFDVPSRAERLAVSKMYYANFGCPLDTAELLADITEGYTISEVAESLIPSIARLSNCKPTIAIVNKVVASTTPATKTHADQVAEMRKAASSLRKANSVDDTFTVH